MFDRNGQLDAEPRREVLLAIGRGNRNIDNTGPWGPTHWTRVDLYGQAILRNAKLKRPAGLITLFSYYHDACRNPETKPDIYHGARAARMFEDHAKCGVIDLPEQDVLELRQAILWHSRPDLKTEPALTELQRVFIDGDRLDMIRCPGVDYPSDGWLSSWVDDELILRAKIISTYRGFVTRETWPIIDCLKAK